MTPRTGIAYYRILCRVLHGIIFGWVYKTTLTIFFANEIAHYHDHYSVPILLFTTTLFHKLPVIRWFVENFFNEH